MKNKRAVSYDLLMWVPKIGLLIFVLTTILLLVRSSMTDATNTGELESSIFLNRLLYNTLAYEENGRLYPGIIDTRKFNDEYINASLDSGDYGFSMGVYLELISKRGDVILDAYYNDFFYSIAKPLDWSNKYQSFVKRYFILIRGEDGALSEGVMQATVVVPR